jgi:L-amino acid N-acyltransferase YncA
LQPPQRTFLTLRDGALVHVRPLRREDRAGLKAELERLSEESRYLRFASAKPSLSPRELDFLVNVDHHDHEALVATDPRTKRGVAVVRYVQVRGEPGVVEIAATVADDWQGRGLGGAMIAQLAGRAREEGHTVMRASVLAANSRSIAMLRRGGFVALGNTGIMREYERPLRSDGSCRLSAGGPAALAGVRLGERRWGRGAGEAACEARSGAPDGA